MGWSRSPDGSPPRRARPGSSRVWILGRFNLLMQSLDAPSKPPTYSRYLDPW
jgi:hypothetical protein